MEVEANFVAAVVVGWIVLAGFVVVVVVAAAAAVVMLDGNVAEANDTCLVVDWTAGVVVTF